MATYSGLDRILHRLALQVTAIAEMSFDLDQRMVSTDPARIIAEQHVFVSGLARAGTTMLMRRLYATGAFRSLTYRDMPFVLAPNLWRKLARVSTRDVVATERAHGDGIVVDADSPESLEEVFWRVFTGADYIAATHLKPHSPDAETTWTYVRYINAILHAQDGRTSRYLCKNNNNVLRLEGIRRAFPHALILIPFRHPAEHAASLLHQHRRFRQMHAADNFARDYMTWLVHHEFGQDHRPFCFDGDVPAATSNVDSIEYWLNLWRATYGWLERSAPTDAIFICYEDLCSRPDVWRRLAEIAGVPVTESDDVVFRPRETQVIDACTDRIAQTSAIYDRLVDRARSSL